VLPHRPEVVAEMRLAAGLDAGEDAHGAHGSGIGPCRTQRCQSFLRGPDLGKLAT
jgi:hypothetical protein